MSTRPVFYSQPFMIKMDPAMHRNLKRVAGSRGLTASEMVRRLLLNYFEQVKYLNDNGVDLLKG